METQHVHDHHHRAMDGRMVDALRTLGRHRPVGWWRVSPVSFSQRDQRRVSVGMSSRSMSRPRSTPTADRGCGGATAPDTKFWSPGYDVPPLPVTLRIRSGRIRSCREDGGLQNRHSGWCPIVLARCPGWRRCHHCAEMPSCLLEAAESLCSTGWIGSAVSSIRRLFWSRSGPMAGLRFRRGVGWCCSYSRGARRQGAVVPPPRGSARRYFVRQADRCPVVQASP